eukprot:GGOE01034495.1.p1 GENE.GGOE01034495.1~~GGOE01034495.1.p1  ORF type:complete len:104 (-),score=3.60 GGOE01034495.1:235-546(-)
MSSLLPIDTTVNGFVVSPQTFDIFPVIGKPKISLPLQPSWHWSPAFSIRLHGDKLCMPWCIAVTPPSSCPSPVKVPSKRGPSQRSLDSLAPTSLCFRIQPSLL